MNQIPYIDDQTQHVWCDDHWAWFLERIESGEVSLQCLSGAMSELIASGYNAQCMATGEEPNPWGLAAYVQNADLRFCCRLGSKNMEALKEWVTRPHDCNS